MRAVFTVLVYSLGVAFVYGAFHHNIYRRPCIN
jgi:hypothetical protein